MQCAFLLVSYTHLLKSNFFVNRNALLWDAPEEVGLLSWRLGCITTSQLVAMGAHRKLLLATAEEWKCCSGPPVPYPPGPAGTQLSSHHSGWRDPGGGWVDHWVEAEHLGQEMLKSLRFYETVAVSPTNYASSLETLKVRGTGLWAPDGTVVVPVHCRGVGPSRVPSHWSDSMITVKSEVWAMLDL